jgi:hypothetical protein
MYQQASEWGRNGGSHNTSKSKRRIDLSDRTFGRKDPSSSIPQYGWSDLQRSFKVILDIMFYIL